MIGIRVDGNAKLGTGHIMRCLSISRELRTMGSGPVFFCAQKSERIEEAGYTCVELGGVYSDLSHEELLPVLRRYNVDTLLVDSYYTDAAYYERLGGAVKVAVLFDMGDSTIPCDLLVDYNVNYTQFDFPGAKTTLLGPRYAPLREEFRPVDVAPRQFGAVHSILVTAGGSDPAQATGAVVQALRQEPALAGIALHVVVGGMNPMAAQLRAAAQQEQDVYMLENVTNMAELMRAADICVSAGGTTLYEICACGLPCVVFSAADNQDAMAAAMQDAGAMLNAGIYRRDKQRCLRRIVRQVRELATDTDLREALSVRAQSLVDGRGAQHIARALLALQR